MTRRRNAVLDRALAQLRELAVQRDAGAFVGSEDELMRQLGVSRPTLRQAAVLVMQEQLLVARPGPKGGYFAAKPTVTGVAHMAAIFLDAHGAGLHEIVEAVEPIRSGVARLATRGRDAANREQMRAFLVKEHAFDEGHAADWDLLTAEREFNALLARMSGNRVLGLFTEMLNAFTQMAIGGPQVWSENPTRIQQYRRLRNRMAEAIIEGDEEIAALTASRAGAVLTDWMMESVSETRRIRWRT